MVNGEDSSAEDSKRILGWILGRIFVQDPGFDSAIDSDSDLMMTILAWILGRILQMILGRIFCRRSSMKDSGIDSVMDSDLLKRILGFILLF